MTSIESKAREAMNKMSVDKLVPLWEETSKKKTTPEVAEVRGWILDALENKNPEGLDNYYDGFYEDEQLRDFVL